MSQGAPLTRLEHPDHEPHRWDEDGTVLHKIAGGWMMQMVENPARHNRR
jgi:hypothetical protein